MATGKESPEQQLKVMWERLSTRKSLSPVQLGVLIGT